MELVTVNHFNDFQVLDAYAKGRKTLEHRPDALATISAGERGSNGIPRVSRDGTIILHDPEGRAPGLLKILNSTKGKKLTITPISDDPRVFLQQRFTRYSAGRLEVHGDEFQLTEIIGDPKDPRHVPHPAGSAKYNELLETCKVSSSFYFYLAEWIEDFTTILMPDGLGPYRLRFTSRNSVANIMASLKTVANYSGGKVAGVPFDLQLVNREVADPSGAKRKVPVWTLTMKKPGGLALDAQSFRNALESGIHEASLMQLPAPRAETIEMAALEPDLDLDVIELDPEDARHLESGIDYKFRLKQWHMMVKGTELEPEDKQHDFLTEQTDYVSRSEAAKYLSESDWGDLLTAAAKAITAAGKQHIEAKAEKALADLDNYQEGITQEHISSLNKLVTSCDIAKTGALSFIGWLAAEKIVTKKDITPETVLKAEANYTDISDVADVKEEYQKWLASDEAAEDALS